jgi:glycosyltransferase involved in cell wall biosynthesis
VKIALIGPVYPYRGGIAQYTARLAQVLRARHDVEIFSFKRQYPSWLYPGRSDKDPSRKAPDIKATYSIDSLNPLTWLHTAGEIRNCHPNMLIIEWWVTFWAPAFSLIACLCRRARIPIVFLIHNVLPHEKSWLHRPLAWITLMQGMHFIVHTLTERERLLNLIPGAKVEVCPHPVYDLRDETAMPSRQEARRLLHLPDAAKVLLFFGIVRPYKGLTFLIDALAQLHSRIQDLYLVIAGEFWEDKAAYEKKIETLGLSTQVRLEDRYIPNEEVGVYYRAADLAVAPYISGTQSGVSALALGFGTPLIVTEWSAPGLDEVYLQSVWEVPSGNVKALAQAISDFFQDPHNPQSFEGPPPSNSWEILATTIERIAL